MKAHKITPKKTKAQAMVEFAIVLPILLLLLYGLLEAGRLLFIYSTIVTATRQAVRYGSATGLGTGTAERRYQDCAGIRAAAQRVDFLNSFEDEDIHIFYDEGPNPPNATGLNEQEFCFNPMPEDPSFDPGTHNDRRLVVRIDGNYFPIVPKIVPFLERSDTSANGPITSSSARTVLVSVPIEVTIPPSSFTPYTPTSTPSKTPTPTPTPTDTPTPTPTFTPVFTDTPTSTPTTTPTATITNTPTPSFTPTLEGSPVPACNGLTHSTISLPDWKNAPSNTMSMSITNPYSYPIYIGNIFLVWNNDSGHHTGGDKTLILLYASINATMFWDGRATGGVDSYSTTISPNTGLPAFIPPGPSTLTFYFHQTYDDPDGSEEILINFASNGCQLDPIHEKAQP